MIRNPKTTHFERIVRLLLIVGWHQKRQGEPADAKDAGGREDGAKAGDFLAAANALLWRQGKRVGKRGKQRLERFLPKVQLQRPRQRREVASFSSMMESSCRCCPYLVLNCPPPEEQIRPPSPKKKQRNTTRIFLRKHYLKVWRPHRFDGKCR